MSAETPEAHSSLLGGAQLGVGVGTYTNNQLFVNTHYTKVSPAAIQREFIPVLLARTSAARAAVPVAARAAAIPIKLYY
jgi:hypothetical protein